MNGGIMAGAVQVVSSGFRIATDVFKFDGGKNSGIGNKFIKILSPDKSPSVSKNKFNGGTIIKIMDNVRIDVSSGDNLLHLQVKSLGDIHIRIGEVISGLIGGISDD